MNGYSLGVEKGGIVERTGSVVSPSWGVSRTSIFLVLPYNMRRLAALGTSVLGECYGTSVHFRASRDGPCPAPVQSQLRGRCQFHRLRNSVDQWQFIRRDPC